LAFANCLKPFHVSVSATHGPLFLSHIQSDFLFCARFSRLTVILSRLRLRTWLGTQEDRYPDFRAPRRRLWGCDVDDMDCGNPLKKKSIPIWTDSRTETPGSTRLSSHTPMSIHGAQTEKSRLCSLPNFLNIAGANA